MMTSQSPKAAQPTDIRGVLIAVARARLLLPNATIAEVLSFAPPSPVEGAPEWLLGRIRWRGWELPLISFSRMADIAPEAGGLGSKVVVLKALGGDPKAPYFAILTQGFPRLVTVSTDRLLHEPDEQLPRGVHARVWLNEDEAFIPDLEAIQALIGNALAQAEAA
jgi:chemosensory pili system protein ChpC